VIHVASVKACQHLQFDLDQAAPAMAIVKFVTFAKLLGSSRLKPKSKTSSGAVMLEVQLNANISMRLIERRHATALFEFVEAGREDLQPWIPFVSKTKTPEDALTYVLRFLDMYKEGKGYVYGLWDGGKMVGLVLIKDIDEAARHAEIGYMIASAYRGKGLAAAACVHLINFIFDNLGFQKVVLCCDDRNEASIAIARRFGFVLEGVLKRQVVINGELCNTMHWALFQPQSTCLPKKI
jgi:ribosomal-protein-serine acetyltransferase